MAQYSNNFFKGLGIGILGTLIFWFALLIIWTSNLGIDLFNMILAWFKNWNPIFIGCGYIAATISLPCAVYQISLVKKHSQAKVAYQILNDSVNIEKSVEDEEVYIYLVSEGPCKPLDDRKAKLAEKKIREILQFYCGLLIQRNYGNINSKQWKLIEKNFSNILRRHSFKTYWTEKIAKKEGWPTDFIYMGNKFLQRKEKR